ncbi:MAG TPA: phosphohistidine phosphatase SixA [Verrucomicrobiae bacterium]|nr:phosphohistidine phosphatase SixA [Verrucomicrobiae bacterium]
MNLFILRHGIAVERDPVSFPDDSLRPLTLKGEDRLKTICEAMKALELSFDYLFSSPFRRASQTAEIVAEAMGLKKVLEFRDELTPDGDPKALVKYLGKLEPTPRNIMLVGHEPYLSSFISQLIFGEATAGIDLKKGGLAKLEIESQLRFGPCAKLAWLLTPKQLVLMV